MGHRREEGQVESGRMGCLGLKDEVGFTQVYRRKRTVHVEGVALAKERSAKTAHNL